MTRNGHSDFSFRVRSLFAVITVVLALLSSGNQAATITLSHSSLVAPSLTILNNLTTNSLSNNKTKTTSVRTNSIASSLTVTSSSKNTQNVHSRHTKTWTKSSWITMSQTESTSVTQFNTDTTTPAIPTTVVKIKGLPSVKVVAAIAGVLGAILLILLAIIVWNFCIAEDLHTRRSSRVIPSDIITENVSEVS